MEMDSRQFPQFASTLCTSSGLLPPSPPSDAEKEFIRVYPCLSVVNKGAIRECGQSAALNQTADQPKELTMRATIWRRRVRETEPRRSVKSDFATS
jgi:hypothetical protein